MSCVFLCLPVQIPVKLSDQNVLLQCLVTLMFDHCQNNFVWPDKLSDQNVLLQCLTTLMSNHLGNVRTIFVLSRHCLGTCIFFFDITVQDTVCYGIVLVYPYIYLLHQKCDYTVIMHIYWLWLYYYRHEAERLEQEAKGRLERQKIMDEAEAERARKELLELQAKRYKNINHMVIQLL